MKRRNRPLLAGLIAAALLAAAGCGGDDENTADTPPSSPATTTTSTGDDRGATTGKGTGGGETTAEEGQDRSSSSDEQLGSQLRDRLREGAEGGLSAADVVGVDVRRTSVVVRTKLGRDDAQRASNVCSQMRLYLAQEPSRGSTNTVTVVGGNRAVLTRC